MADQTPRSIFDDFLEERGRLYWEKVGEYVDSAVDRWKEVKPDVEGVWKFLENSCTSYSYVAFKDPFEAFVVLHHTKNARAIFHGTLGGKDVLKDAFWEKTSFPWVQLAFHAFQQDCEDGVLAKLGKEFDEAESLPEG